MGRRNQLRLARESRVATHPLQNLGKRLLNQPRSETVMELVSGTALQMTFPSGEATQCRIE
jgi:hypothetical protein